MLTPLLGRITAGTKSESHSSVCLFKNFMKCSPAVDHPQQPGPLLIFGCTRFYQVACCHNLGLRIFPPDSSHLEYLSPTDPTILCIHSPNYHPFLEFNTKAPSSSKKCPHITPETAVGPAWNSSDSLTSSSSSCTYIASHHGFACCCFNLL